MSAKIAFHELATAELQEAAQYYEVESEGLGRVFIEHIEATVKRIGSYPDSAPLINKTVRKMIVPRFPYTIMYSFAEDAITILAIANQKRRPYYWRGRH